MRICMMTSLQSCTGSSTARSPSSVFSENAYDDSPAVLRAWELGSAAASRCSTRDSAISASSNNDSPCAAPPRRLLSAVPRTPVPALPTATELEVQATPVVLHAYAKPSSFEAEILSCVQQHGRFEVLSTLGASTFGFVFLAIDGRSNSKVAVKVSHMALMRRVYEANHIRADADVIESPILEAKLMSLLSSSSSCGRHPNVLSLEDEFFSHDYTLHWLVMEYAPNKDLFEYIGSRGHPHPHLPPEETKALMTQFIRGLQHIHSNGICHLDLSLENALLGEHNTLKICDFGVARKLPANNALFPPLHVRSKRSYMAPEVLRRLPFDGRKADVFSLGVALFCMLVGYKPFEYADKSQLSYCLIASGRVNEYLRRCRSPIVLSADAHDLISGMLCPEYRRYSLDQVAAHAFFNCKA